METLCLRWGEIQLKETGQNWLKQNKVVSEETTLWEDGQAEQRCSDFPIVESVPVQNRKGRCKPHGKGRQITQWWTVPWQRYVSPAPPINGPLRLCLTGDVQAYECLPTPAKELITSCYRSGGSWQQWRISALSRVPGWLVWRGGTQDGPVGKQEWIWKQSKWSTWKAFPHGNGPALFNHPHSRRHPCLQVTGVGKQSRQRLVKCWLSL